MAQIDFFLCKAEKLQFADLLFKFGFLIVPDLYYKDKTYIIISSLHEYEPYASDNSLLFILHPETFKYELEMRFLEKKGGYYISQTAGGPTIEFYSPGMIEERDKRIGPGSLSNRSSFYNKNEKIPLDQTSIEFYKMLAKYIKQQSVYVKLVKRGYWVGKKTIQMCRNEGYTLVDIGGKNLIEMIQ